MRYRLSRGLVLTILLGPFLVAALTAIAQTTAGSTSIQEKIDNEAYGEAVGVPAGVHRVNLVIDRPLTLRGIRGAVLVPADPSRPVITVTQDQGVWIEIVEIRDARIGIEVTAREFAMTRCSVTASDIGVNITSLPRKSEFQVIAIDRCAFDGTGIGVLATGSGVFGASDCTFDGLGIGLAIRTAGPAVVSECVIRDCVLGASLSVSTGASVYASEIRDCLHSGIEVRFDPAAEPSATLAMSTNLIVDNRRWGLSFCRIDGAEHDASLATIFGTGNRFSGNGWGPICPVELELPEIFFEP